MKRILLSSLVLLSCLVLLAPTVLAEKQMYRHINAKGQVTFSDRRLHDGFIPMQRTWKGWVEMSPPANLREGVAKFRPIVRKTSARYELSPALISAVIHAESYYNPLAISKKGAVGLMQLMPGTAARYGVYDRQNPEQNVDGGVRYLRDLLEMFDNNTALAVAAYNAGENAVISRGYKIPPFPETQKYVKRVLSLIEKYEQELL